jgi:hypothetical protein
VEVKIGNKYKEEFCSSCGQETTHRIYKRFGKAQRGKGKGRFRLRRQVTYCLSCQQRRIDKPERRKGRKT